MIQMTVGSEAHIGVPANWRYYLIWVAFAAVAVRITVSLCRSIELHCPGIGYSTKPGKLIKKSRMNREHGWGWNFLRDVSGFHRERTQRDWLQTFFLGFLEIAAYPILLAQGHYQA